MTITFPQLWFEGNLYSGWIENAHDLQKVFDAYEGQMEPTEILKKAVNRTYIDDEGDVVQDFTNFGLRSEHKGDMNLDEFIGMNMRRIETRVEQPAEEETQENQDTE